MVDTGIEPVDRHTKHAYQATEEMKPRARYDEYSAGSQVQYRCVLLCGPNCKQSTSKKCYKWEVGTALPRRALGALITAVFLTRRLVSAPIKYFRTHVFRHMVV